MTPKFWTYEIEKQHTPILIAAKMGVTEMVEKILDEFPVAIQDVDIDNKNIVLLAVEYRQPQVYDLLLHRKILKENVFRQLDKDGNSALHLAAQCKEQRPWLIAGVAFQMQWEIKWYKVKYMYVYVISSSIIVIFLIFLSLYTNRVK